MAKRKSKAEIEAEKKMATFVGAVIAVLIFWASLRSGETWAIVLLVVILVFVVGVLMYLVKKRRKKTKYENTMELKIIDKMSGIEFEHYIADLFTKDGYKTTVTSGSSDYGADIVMKKDEKTIVVQTKRYNNAVGFAAVKEIYTAKKFYKADEAWVITNNERFTRNAQKAAKHNDVRLINREALYKIINQHGG